MGPRQRPLSLEEGLILLQEKGKTSSLCIDTILSILPGKGRLLILMAFSLPFCQPIQIPGLSLPFGLAIFLIGLRMVFGKQAWLPKTLLNKKVKSSTLQKITKVALRWTHRLSRWIHPRWLWLSNHPLMHIVHGILISLLGLFLSLPLPIPFSNLTAAWSIFLLSLGLLENDGIFVTIGSIFGIATVIGFTLAALLLKQII